MNTKSKGSVTVIVLCIAIVAALVIGIWIGKKIAHDRSIEGPTIGGLIPGPGKSDKDNALPPNNKDITDARHATSNAAIISTDYASYENPSFGFSTMKSKRLRLVDTPQEIGYNQAPEGVRVLTFAFLPDKEVLGHFGLVVFQTDVDACVKSLAPSKNQHGYSISENTFAEGAAGTFYTEHLASVANGKRAYCIVGFSKATNAYNAYEGDKAATVSKNNADTTAELDVAMGLFVDNFKMMNLQ